MPVECEQLARQLKCNHVYHAECLLNWWTHQPRRQLECPTCKQLHPLAKSGSSESSQARAEIEAEFDVEIGIRAPAEVRPVAAAAASAEAVSATGAEEDSGQGVDEVTSANAQNDIGVVGVDSQTHIGDNEFVDAQMGREESTQAHSQSSAMLSPAPMIAVTTEASCKPEVAGVEQEQVSV